MPNRSKKPDSNRRAIIAFRANAEEVGQLALLRAYSGKHLSKVVRDCMALGLRQRLSEMSRDIASDSTGEAKPNA